MVTYTYSSPATASNSPRTIRTAVPSSQLAANVVENLTSNRPDAAEEQSKGDILEPKISAIFDEILKNEESEKRIETPPKKEPMSVFESIASKDENSIVFVWDLYCITCLPIRPMQMLVKKYPHITLAAYRLLKELVIFGPDYRQSSESRILNEFWFINDMKKMGDLYDSLTLYFTKFAERNKHDDLRNYITDDFVEKCGMVGYEEELRQACATLQEKHKTHRQNIQRCLELIEKKSKESKNKKYNSVFLTDSLIGQVSTELLVTGASQLLPFENIYTSIRSSDQAVLKNIQERFGENCRLVTITFDSGTAENSESVDVPVWPIDGDDSILLLEKALSIFLLR